MLRIYSSSSHTSPPSSERFRGHTLRLSPLLLFCLRSNSELHYRSQRHTVLVVRCRSSPLSLHRPDPPSPNHRHLGRSEALFAFWSNPEKTESIRGRGKRGQLSAARVLARAPCAVQEVQREFTCWRGRGNLNHLNEALWGERVERASGGLSDQHTQQ